MISPSTTQHEMTADGTLPRLFQFDLLGQRLWQEGLKEGANPSRVLDIASGAGEWVLALAQAYPQTQVVGIEGDAQLIEVSRTQAQTKGVSNASFAQMNPLHQLDLPDDSFDIVNLRFVATIVPSALWPRVLQECLRVTRPGGIVRLTETDLPISNKHAFEQYSGGIARALYTAHRSFSPDGVSFAITPMLRSFLTEAGCTEIRQATALSNFSTGMPEHTSGCQAIAQTYQMIQPFLRQTNVVSDEEITRLYQEMVSEMQSDDFCAVAFYLTVWGKKP